MRKISLAFMAVAISMNVCAEEMPEGYYNNIDGKKDKTLKSAIRAAIRSHTAIPYGSGKGNTWEVFYYSDRDPVTGECMDMYCDDWSVISSPGQVASGCNIEHNFAKSWWGGSKNDAYKDCYHLNPSNATANSARSNYPLGVPTKEIKTSGTGSLKVGKATYNGQTFWVFEPKDEYKGDFARAYFYMATCYGDELTWAKGNKDVGSYYAMRPSNDANEYLEFMDWEIDVLLKWHRQDPVSEKELNRMDAVSDFQHNRNPYIDYPELVEYIWGNKKGQTLNLASLTRTTGIDDVFVGAKPEVAKLLVNGRLVIRKDGILYDLSGRRE